LSKNTSSNIRPFNRTVVDFDLPKGHDRFEHTYSLRTPDNSALSLAEREDFMGMCEDILWGSEDRQKFGEFLRGLIITFLPENRFHLALLKNIAVFQWQLNRHVGTQSNLFEAQAGSRGRYGLPEGVWNANSLRGDASELIKDLNQAIKAYNSATG